MFVDTHCHLNFHEYAGDLPAVLARAKSNGVGSFIIPAIDLQSSVECLFLSDKHRNIHSAIGVHPNDISGISPESIRPALQDLLTTHKPVAIGEIGLDYYHNASDKDKQKKVLISQIELAIDNRLPVILHSRESIIDLLKLCASCYPEMKCVEEKKYNGVFHAFEGSSDQALQAYQLGFLIGIGGPITYTNAKIKQDVVREVPLSSILLETDSPFLSPSPLRGTRNEPANIKIIAERIAILKECDIKLVEYQTTQNARALFNIGEEIDFN